MKTKKKNIKNKQKKIFHTFITTSSYATILLGKKTAQFFKPGDVIALIGKMGSGKTYLTKGIVLGLGGKKEEVVSPTFKIINEYLGKVKIFHIDLFRLEKEEDFLNLALEEFLYNKNTITIVEWAEKIEKYLFKNYIKIQINICGENSREIKIKNKNVL